MSETDINSDSGGKGRGIVILLSISNMRMVSVFAIIVDSSGNRMKMEHSTADFDGLLSSDITSKIVIPLSLLLLRFVSASTLASRPPDRLHCYPRPLYEVTDSTDDNMITHTGLDILSRDLPDLLQKSRW